MRRFLSIAGLSVLLAACGGQASAPAASPAGSAAASKPAAALASGKPAASGAVASGLIKIKTAYSQVSAVQGPLYIASDQGFFKKYGLDVQISQVGGTAQVPAMTANELQVGTPGGQELVSANLGGASIVMIAVTSNYPLFSIYGSKGITDVKQLSGKTVAITTAGSSTDAAGKLYLRHFGLDKEVKLQPAGTMQGILAIIEKGDVGGGVISPPTTVKAADAGLKELVNGPKLGDPELHSGISVTRGYLKAHPDIVKNYLRGYLDGWNYVINPANEAGVEKSLQKWTKSTAATAKASYDYAFLGWSKNKVPDVDPKAIDSVLSLVSNPNAKSAKAADFYDNSLIDSLASGK